MSTVYQQARDRQRGLIKSFEAQVRAAPSPVNISESMSAGGSGNLSLLDVSSDRKVRESYQLLRNWVYVAINAIGKRLGGQPVQAGEIVGAPPNAERFTGVSQKAYELGRAKAEWTRKRLPNRVREKVFVDQDLEIIASHPALDVLCKPNPVQRKFEFLWFSAANLLLTGECYWIGGVTGTGDEERVELWAVPTSWVKPQHEEGPFSSYLVQTRANAQPISMPKENVARTYFPNPSDPKACLSPLSAIISAVRVDDSLQRSQEDMFNRGINPNLVVTVGRVQGPDGKLTDRRPRLTGSQRRQLIRAVREVWSNSVNEGMPAVVDGLIESIHKLQMTPAEMDWIQSGDVVKRRIMQAFGVNPIVVGEIIGANRAQASEAERSFCHNAVNPIADAFSETVTDFLGPMYETPERLVLWIEPCDPTDPDLDLRKFGDGRKSGDVTRNEYRSFIGLPPVEDVAERNALLSTVGGMQGTVTILNAVGQGMMTPLQASAALQLFLEIDADIADSLAGVGIPEPIPEPRPAPEPEGEIDEDAEELDDDMDAGSRGVKGKLVPLTKADMKAIHVKQVTQAEGVVSRSMARHFRNSVRETADRIRALEVEPQPERAAEQAADILAQTFDLESARKDLEETAMETLPWVFVSGAIMELELNKAVSKCIASNTAMLKTTAEDILEQLGLAPPEDFGIGPAPEWMRIAAAEELAETFEQDYWLRIDETTRNDIQRAVQLGIDEGFSMRRIAEILDSPPWRTAYPITRGLAIARTEVGNAANAGHGAAIARLEEESGLKIGKEWLSVLGLTTRETHAALDGVQTTSADGMFTLAGIDIPHPAYHTLPAGERVNCMCTILSAPVMDAIE